MSFKKGAASIRVLIVNAARALSWRYGLGTNLGSALTPKESSTIAGLGNTSREMSPNVSTSELMLRMQLQRHGKTCAPH